MAAGTVAAAGGLVSERFKLVSDSYVVAVRTDYGPLPGHELSYLVR